MMHQVFELRPAQRNRVPARRVLWVSVLLLATQAYPQPAGPAFPNPGKTSMSRENQQALGMEVAAQIYQQMPVLPDSSPETQYVRQLGQKLVATIPSQYSWPFEFHVIPQKRSTPLLCRGARCSSTWARSRPLPMNLNSPA